MLLLIVFVREFESHRGDIMNLFAKTEKDQLLRAPSAVSADRRESTTEQRAGIFSRKKCKARTVVRRGGEEPAM